ncbi:peroxiredoxin family protein [Candidatus Omnitrophota bacterium]
MKISARVILCSLVLLVVFQGAALAMGPFIRPVIGEEAPTFHLQSTTGSTVSISTYTKRQPIILFFWTTWCPHCRTQIRSLKTDYAELKKSGIALFTIDSGESEGVVAKYVDREQISFPVLLDKDNKVSRAYRVVGVPTYVLIDGQGIIVHTANAFPNNYKFLLGLEE